jgi:sugar phosphate isomerase/epimerase
VRSRFDRSRPETATPLPFPRAHHPIHQVDRANFGITLDTGHALMAGENAAQSAAAALAAGKLFGLHLNDGHSRIGAEDGWVHDGDVGMRMGLCPWRGRRVGGGVWERED